MRLISEMSGIHPHIGKAAEKCDAIVDMAVENVQLVQGIKFIQW